VVEATRSQVVAAQRTTALAGSTAWQMQHSDMLWCDRQRFTPCGLSAQGRKHDLVVARRALLVRLEHMQCKSFGETEDGGAHFTHLVGGGVALDQRAGAVCVKLQVFSERKSYQIGSAALILIHKLVKISMKIDVVLYKP